MACVVEAAVSLLKPEHYTAEQNQRDLSQWFTPHSLAERVVDWSRVGPGWTVLEPACGDGAIAAAAMVWGARITAYDIDPRMVSACAMAAASAVPASVGGLTEASCADYLTVPPPAKRYDIAILNPPYEHGNDGRFLAKCMDESDVIVGIFRAAILDGKERRASVWSRVERDEWYVAGIAFLGRVAFRIPTGRKPQSASTDFVAIKLTRRYAPTLLEWWT